MSIAAMRGVLFHLAHYRLEGFTVYAHLLPMDPKQEEKTTWHSVV
jgi:hypothetical protein